MKLYSNLGPSSVCRSHAGNVILDRQDVNISAADVDLGQPLQQPVGGESAQSEERRRDLQPQIRLEVRGQQTEGSP